METRIATMMMRVDALAGKAYRVATREEACALAAGRFNVSYEDLEAVAQPTLRHRLILNFEAEAEGITTDMVLEQILKEVSKETTVAA